MRSSVKRKTQNNLWKKLLHKESNNHNCIQNALKEAYRCIYNFTCSENYLSDYFSKTKLQWIGSIELKVFFYNNTRIQLGQNLEATQIERKCSLRSDYNMAYTDYLWNLKLVSWWHRRFRAVFTCSETRIRNGQGKCKYSFIWGFFNKDLKRKFESSSVFLLPRTIYIHVPPHQTINTQS